MEQFVENLPHILAACAFIAAFAAACGLVGRSHDPKASGGPPETLAELEGTYRGFAPTDVSAVAMGEIEISIKDGFLKVRMATGLRIEDDEMSAAEFRPMTVDEIVAHFNEGYEYTGTVIGFRPYGDSYPQLLFVSDGVGEAWACTRLLVRTGGMGEMLGPTLLFSPAALTQGEYEKAVRHVEADFGRVGVIPSLANGGKATV